MTNTNILPFVVGDAQEVELADANGNKKKLWKKEILPNGTRKYKGQDLDFSKINPSVVKAFEDKAVDAVPFVLALSDNKHPRTGEEIKALEGDLDKLEMSNDGRLFGYFDLSDDVATTIRKSKGKLGVSARIDVGYEREDTGKKYDYALRHVCATTAPHIKGMSPWEAVDLSEEEKKDTVDFSTEVIDEKQTDNKNGGSGDDLVALEIPKDQFDKLMAFIGDVEKGEETARKLAEGDGNGNEGEVQLSEEATRRIELAETQARTAFALAEKGQKEAAEARWESRKRELALAGVPPVLLDLAEPVLKLHKRSTIELTEDDGKKTTVDASEALEKVLDAAKGTIQLSKEDGHSFTAEGTANNKEYLDLEKFFLAQ